MIKEAIVLAGGLGTRLREAVPDLPKCMAPVAGQPFLSYVINTLRMQGIRHFIFSLGYKSDAIIDYLKTDYPHLDYSVVIEDEPLGTGGAIRLALSHAQTSHVLVANGDTLFRVQLKDMEAVHAKHGAECTLALKPMQNFDRYGVVETDANGRVLSFKEKQYYASGKINGGIYLIDRARFLQRSFPEKFSFEKDYLEKYCDEGKFYASGQDAYFIDIGIPEDYARAQQELKQSKLDLTKVDKTWTLFLDRDGVINEEKKGDYVLNWKEFIFHKGVLDTFRKLSDRFGKVIVVSNQRGVGRGRMTEAELQSIHLEMRREVEIAGGRIDKIYYCTETEDNCFFRKPNPGMAVQAAKDFPDIDFSKAIMVGNKPGDMKFGRAAGMYTVFVKTTNPEQVFPHPDIDLSVDSLYDLAIQL